MSTKWVLAEPDPGAEAALARGAGLHPFIAKLLVNRGIRDVHEAQSFLSCDLSALTDPALFHGMERAVSRIRAAISKRELIVVYGDYDVDGVTGSALLYLALKSLGARVDIYLPGRMTEGYGLNKAALERLKQAGAGLVVSVDCGITAVREAEAARACGLDLIITDHHEFDRLSGSNGMNLPDSFAVLHPLLMNDRTPEDVRRHASGLTGAGIAFKLVQALLDVPADNGRLHNYLDLVTLGTVADIGKITGENRILVKHGLEWLSKPGVSQRPGIAALRQVAGLAAKKVGVGAVGFSLAPRINASGRLERADAAFRLLTTDSPEEASELAANLDRVNKERQAVEEGITAEARRICRESVSSTTGAFILASETWHQGVVGIVASRIVEEFYRPTALVCLRDGVGKGSARSIPGFDLHAGLSACADLLIGFGGHKYAAGFTVSEENIPAFRERLNAVVLERMGTDGFVKTLNVDGAVTLEELTPGLMQEIGKLEPFGQGNPEPRLGARGLEVISTRVVGNNHLKFRVRQGRGPSLDAIAFGKASWSGRQVKEGAKLAAVFTPRINTWNGSEAVELEIRDIKADK